MGQKTEPVYTLVLELVNGETKNSFIKYKSFKEVYIPQGNFPKPFAHVRFTELVHAIRAYEDLRVKPLYHSRVKYARHCPDGRLMKEVVEEFQEMLGAEDLIPPPPPPPLTHPSPPLSSGGRRRKLIRPDMSDCKVIQDTTSLCEPPRQGSKRKQPL